MMRQGHVGGETEQPIGDASLVKVFLSYRRGTGTEFCSFVRDMFAEEGYSVFFDVHSLRQGPFDEQIFRAIEDCTVFLLILAPHDLDKCLQDVETDWILKEVGKAMECGKPVIPVAIKPGFSFPDPCGNAILDFLRRQEVCDVSGPNAATLVKTRLFEFMKETKPSVLRREYLQGVLEKDYLEWETRTLQAIYGDCDLLSLLGRRYPGVVYPGSPDVRYDFGKLNESGNLLGVEDPLEYRDFPLYPDFSKIVSPAIHFPDLYGYANQGMILDAEGRVEGFKARPRTYNETVYTSHILRYELWRTYRQLGKNRMATLADLPARRRIHAGQSSPEAVLLSGCNRSSLCGICMAVLAYDEIEGDYGIAIATRSTRVLSYPGYLSIVPSGGFELYELESRQDSINIRQNFRMVAALYREYVEELFGNAAFDQATGDDDLRRLLRNDHIRQLREQMGISYFFEFLGVTFDLTSLRPMFCFALKIDDPRFLYGNDIRKNQENTELRFASLGQLEATIQENADTVPLMTESAGLYALLKRNHLFAEASDGQKTNPGEWH